MGRMVKAPDGSMVEIEDEQQGVIVQSPDGPVEIVDAGPPGKLETFATSAAQTATLGFGDEIGAGIDALIHKLQGKAPDLAAEFQRLQQEYSRRQHQGSQANPGEALAGSVVGAAPLVAGMGAAPAVVKQGGLAARSAFGAAEGALAGGITAAGETDGSLQERTEAMPQGAMAGAAIGAIVPPAASKMSGPAAGGVVQETAGAAGEALFHGSPTKGLTSLEVPQHVASGRSLGPGVYATNAPTQAASFAGPGGSIYRLDAQGTLLDLQSPLAAQGPIAEAAQQALQSIGGGQSLIPAAQQTGFDLYRELSAKLGRDGAARALQAAGIDGLSEGTQRVFFDPSKLKIAEELPDYAAAKAAAQRGPSPESMPFAQAPGATPQAQAGGMGQGLMGAASDIASQAAATAIMPGHGALGMMTRGALRRLFQREFVPRISDALDQDPARFGRFFHRLSEARKMGHRELLFTHQQMLNEDQEYRDLMLDIAGQEEDESVSDEIGALRQTPADALDDPQERMRDMMETRRLAQDPERKQALKVGNAASRDLAMLSDVADEAVGRADGLNDRFRVDMPAMMGVARLRVFKQLDMAGDGDGAAKFDEFMDALEDDVMGLTEQSYHPNAVPLRVATQLMFEVDKHPALNSSSGFGKGLRQFRNMLSEEIERKMQASAGLAPDVDAEGFSRALDAYNEALRKTVMTQPASWIKMAKVS